MRVRPTICTQLDWATAGTQLGAPDVLRRTPDSFEKIFGRSSSGPLSGPGAAYALHREAPHPAPPRSAVNVDVGAPSVTTSAHADRAVASGQVDVADVGTDAAGGVAALE